MAKIIPNFEDFPTTNKNIYKLVLDKYDGNVSAFSKAIEIQQQKVDRLFRIDKRSNKFPAVSEDILNAIIDKLRISKASLVLDGAESPIHNAHSGITITTGGSSKDVVASIGGNWRYQSSDSKSKEDTVSSDIIIELQARIKELENELEKRDLIIEGKNKEIEAKDMLISVLTKKQE